MQVQRNVDDEQRVTEEYDYFKLLGGVSSSRQSDAIVIDSDGISHALLQELPPHLRGATRPVSFAEYHVNTDEIVLCVPAQECIYRG